MSEEQLKAFLSKAKDDQSIQDKLKAAKSPEDVVGIAKDHGFEFTADKITDLSEEELEGVAGGCGGGASHCWNQTEHCINTG
ncbi:nif11-like leader peptide domain protein [Synechococcus sp. BIOS-E4-1]|uniref:Nif11-like leader peptide family natural product precursor n=1 Tax=Synechococcus sp. BIOS-E4-1 TaxID=1400864 RepID=UPI0016480234|nr:Nif11-like leader peptide family natural product precursor [Synechococcus sp. BIOS-E4-1]QNI53615.1 nif11-like leader peptide domain protein [Synechococcus sp. BIOS-E4-1]